VSFFVTIVHHIGGYCSCSLPSDTRKQTRDHRQLLLTLLKEQFCFCCVQYAYIQLHILLLKHVLVHTSYIHSVRIPYFQGHYQVPAQPGHTGLIYLHAITARYLFMVFKITTIF